MKKIVPLFVIGILFLVSCGGATPEATTPPEDGEEGGGEEVLSTPAPDVPEVLPPEPQEIAFEAEDGYSLTGYYYPAAVSPAPVVVFMHWVGGNLSDWYELAVWLQNRGLANPFENPADETWWDPTWFPVVPEDRSYGVFIFSFRECEPYAVGCAGWTPEAWLLDAQAALQTAKGLEGVDPTRLATIGSSIGADAAADACAWLNDETSGSCQGALSLSPGGYLNIPYLDAVKNLGENDPPTAAWCLADENEIGLCEAAEEAGNTAYRTILVTGGSHGNRMLAPELDPLPAQLILDFLAETVGP